MDFYYKNDVLPMPEEDLDFKIKIDNKEFFVNEKILRDNFGYLEKTIDITGELAEYFEALINIIHGYDFASAKSVSRTPGVPYEKILSIPYDHLFYFLNILDHYQFNFENFEISNVDFVKLDEFLILPSSHKHTKILINKFTAFDRLLLVKYVIGNLKTNQNKYSYLTEFFALARLISKNNILDVHKEYKNIYKIKPLDYPDISDIIKESLVIRPMKKEDINNYVNIYHKNLFEDETINQELEKAIIQGQITKNGDYYILLEKQFSQNLISKDKLHKKNIKYSNNKNIKFLYKKNILPVPVEKLDFEIQIGDELIHVNKKILMDKFEYFEKILNENSPFMRIGIPEITQTNGDKLTDEVVEYLKILINIIHGYDLASAKSVSGTPGVPYDLASAKSVSGTPGVPYDLASAKSVSGTPGVPYDYLFDFLDVLDYYQFNFKNFEIVNINFAKLDEILDINCNLKFLVDKLIPFDKLLMVKYVIEKIKKSN